VLEYAVETMARQLSLPWAAILEGGAPGGSLVVRAALDGPGPGIGAVVPVDGSPAARALSERCTVECEHIDVQGGSTPLGDLRSCLAVPMIAPDGRSGCSRSAASARAATRPRTGSSWRSPRT
jgi:hypothetical protein